MKKVWKKPQIMTLIAQELELYIKVAAKSSYPLCTYADGR